MSIQTSPSRTKPRLKASRAVLLERHGQRELMQGALKIVEALFPANV
jgi:hypothetical protein